MTLEETIDRETCTAVVPGYHAIVLAAGAGRRFGGGKLLTEWRGRPLIQKAMEVALAAPVDTVSIVLGHDADRIMAALELFEDHRLCYRICGTWSAGLSASLRCGVEGLPPDALGAVVFLGDMPEVPASLAGCLIDALQAGAIAAETRFDDLPAHPVAFSRALFDAACSLHGDQGLRYLLPHLTNVAKIASEDRGSVFDVDRPEDLDGATQSNFT
jgi:molybdenum cofactor cytidylyltransferase